MDWKKVIKDIFLPRPPKPGDEKVHELKVELADAGYVILQVKVDFTKAEKSERDFISDLIGKMQDFNNTMRAH